MSKAAKLAAVAIGQWRVIDDQLLTAPAPGFTIALPVEFKQFRMTLDILPVLGSGADAGNLYPTFRLSKDGGTTYLSGATDYYISGGYTINDGSQVINTMTALTMCHLGVRTSNLYNTVGQRCEVTFRNEEGAYFMGKSNFHGLSSQWFEGQYLIYHSYTTRSTHMKIMAGDVAGSPYAPGSRMILEAR